jgi:hypothetical protein
VFALFVAGFGSYWLQPHYHESKDASDVLVTVFSVLAGFLIAVMTLLGDERSLRRARNWGEAVSELERLELRLLRHKWTFLGYLIVLLIAFALSLESAWKEPYRLWAERAVLFVGGFAFLASFRLPSLLIGQQLEALRGAIKDRRSRENSGGE